MKKIYLLRHVKSDWSQPGAKDFDRVLNDRGFRDAPVMAEFIQKVIPLNETLIVSSPAKRTRQTLEPLEKKYSGELNIRFDENLYESGIIAYLKVLRSLPDTCQSVLLVGHNPSIQDTVEFITAGENAYGMIEVPTGTLISIEVPVVDWKWIQPSSGVLRWMVHPKMLHALKS